MSREKVTVVIPTRDRLEVLRYSLKSVMDLKYPFLEIIVSDNSSDDGTAAYLKEISDERVKCIRTPKRYSMTSNWEFALSHVHDGWVTVIGDDDALLPNGIEDMLDLAAKTNAKIVRSTTCSYSWPGLLGAKISKGRVRCQNGHEVRQTKATLQKVLDGKIGYAELPVLYNGGFVHSSILEKLRRIDGKLIHSEIPDVYLGIALSLLEETYTYSFKPFAINGASDYSGGTHSFKQGALKASHRFDPSNKFMKETELGFPKNYPLINGKHVPLLQAIVASVYEQASEKVGSAQIRFDRKDQIEMMYAEAHSRSDFDDIKHWFAQYSKLNNLTDPCGRRPRYWAKLRILKNKFRVLIKSISIIRVNGKGKRDLDNISDANVLFSEIIKNNTFILSIACKSIYYFLLEKVQIINDKR